MRLPANGNDGPRANSAEPNESAALRLHGYVVRTEPLTSNRGWTGSGVLFPGSRDAQPALPAPAAD